MPAQRLAVAAVVVASLSGALSGCGTKSEDARASLTAAELQQSLADRLTQAGTAPRAVSCAKDLPQAPGRTVRCNVEFSATDVVTAVLTTTVDDYEITGPELSKEQLETRMRGMMPAQFAVCEAGLKGSVESWTRCSVTSGGLTSDRIVEVTTLAGLRMQLTAVSALPKQQVEQRLTQDLAGIGLGVESVECAQDLLGVPGTTMACEVRTPDGKRQTYDLTSTDVGGGQVGFTYARRPGPAR